MLISDLVAMPEASYNAFLADFSKSIIIHLGFHEEQG
jgi:hypothetical protein